MLTMEEITVKNRQVNIEGEKRSAIKKLEEGLAQGCADDITEVLVNLEDGTCDYVEMIPILKRIASSGSFYYFDDNGAGGFPHPDLNRETSFEAWALKAIENIKENAGFEANSDTAIALKSNDTDLIKKTLENLTAEGVCADTSLIPILEKIARKDVYQSYSYYGGFKTECQLGEHARNVIQIILQNYEQDKNVEDCSLCGTLPDDLTVNTGRGVYFPAVFKKLTSIDSEYNAEFRRCPECGVYFNWIDLSQMYGSGNCDEEQLVRFSAKASRLLDKLFSADPKDHPTQKEVGEYLNALSIQMLLKALKTRVYAAPNIIVPFVPILLKFLGQNNDYTTWSLLHEYVSNKPERAEEILKACGFSRSIHILRHCLEVVGKKN